MSVRVLVVDDSEVTRAILSRTLRGAGFEVLEARDGAEGAVKALQELPSVVVTDLEMPTMDGFPLLRLLKTDPLSSHIPVLILTSHGEAASRFWSRRTGADAYLTKDYRPQQLVTTVARLAENAAAVAGGNANAQGSPAAEEASSLGPLEVLARVARQLDASLLQATLINSLLERGMAAADFHGACSVSLETLGQVVDARCLAVAVAEPDAAIIEILLLEPLHQRDVDALRDLVVANLELAPGFAIESRVTGTVGDGTALDLEPAVGLQLAVRDAQGFLVVVPRDREHFSRSTSGLIHALAGHLTLVLDNARLSERLHEMSTRDGLTRQLNHRAIYERLTEELARSLRYRYPLSVILVDMDHFKEVNDSYGHLAGDAVLREGAAVLRDTLRTGDLLGRYGGEEFLVVLPQVDLESAQAAAERLRRSLEDLAVPMPSGDAVKITASFGVASRDELPASAATELLVSLADRRLYEAKAAGRNRICP